MAEEKHCERQPDCLRPWDESCSCRCEGCHPRETCPDCGDVHGIYDEHESNNCVEVLKARLAAAEKERDDWAFRCGGAEAERDVARANYLRCAQAIGVVDEPEGHAVQPGPIEDVERYIREAVRRGDRAIDADVARREAALREAAGVCARVRLGKRSGGAINAVKECEEAILALVAGEEPGR